MIERSKIIELLRKIERVYAPRMEFNQELVDIWCEMFADCNEKGLELAVNNCIKNSEYPPTVATLMKYYRELEESRKEIIETMTSKYATMRYMWGEEYRDETFKAIVDYIYRFPKEQRKVQMVELTHHAISFYNDCVSVGRSDIPTIKEYVEGKR